MNLRAQDRSMLEEERQNLHEMIKENGQRPLCKNIELLEESQKLDAIIACMQKEAKS